MRPALAAGVPVGLALLGCGGLFGAPEIRLESARGGPCATVEAVVLTEPWKEDRALSVRIDGQATEPLRLPAGEVTATFERPALPGRHTLEVEGASIEVTVPPVDVAADWPGWERPPRQGDPAEILLRVTGACPLPELTLSAELPDDGRSLVRREPVSGPVVRLDASGLSQGAHRLVVTLRRGELVVDERTLALSIAEPCTGPTCKDRDNDGFVSKKFGGPDCDDFDAAVHPGAVAFPDPDGDGAVVRPDLDIDCDGEIEHFDGPVDCAEGDPTIPRPEDPDPTGVDEDCDGIVDEGTIAYDDDGDGFSEEKGDCRDDDRTVSPVAKEQPDCKDNDCDGQVDEGVTRPTDEDRYEPDDDRPFALAGATPLRNPFGGHRTTRDELALRIRDGKDVERFSVFAHDGALDDFHVRVELLSVGDGLVYEATITGPAGEITRRLDHNGDSVSIPTAAFKNETGVYEIRVAPVGEHPAQCPLQIAIDTG